MFLTGVCPQCVMNLVESDIKRFCLNNGTDGNRTVPIALFSEYIQRIISEGNLCLAYLGQDHSLCILHVIAPEAQDF